MIRNPLQVAVLISWLVASMQTTSLAQNAAAPRIIALRDAVAGPVQVKISIDGPTVLHFESGQVSAVQMEDPRLFEVTVRGNDVILQAQVVDGETKSIIVAGHQSTQWDFAVASGQVPLLIFIPIPGTRIEGLNDVLVVGNGFDPTGSEGSFERGTQSGAGAGTGSQGNGNGNPSGSNAGGNDKGNSGSGGGSNSSNGIGGNNGPGSGNGGASGNGGVGGSNNGNPSGAGSTSGIGNGNAGTSGASGVGGSNNSGGGGNGGKGGAGGNGGGSR